VLCISIARSIEIDSAYALCAMTAREDRFRCFLSEEEVFWIFLRNVADNFEAKN
jgi:hypothetical protein